MIRYAPPLAPVPGETRDLVQLFLQSMSLAPQAIERMPDTPVTRVVRMPRYIRVGMTTGDGVQITHSLDGKRVLHGKPGLGSLREEPKGPADAARNALDTVAFGLRDVLAEAKSIVLGLEAVPEPAREAWQVDALLCLRAAMARLDGLAFEQCDALRVMVPEEG